MRCWKCYHPIEEKIRFRTECTKCGVYLHCCKNCKNYSPGKPNDCLVPGTELIIDREAANYCEDFEATTVKQTKTIDPKKRFDSLFE